MISNYEDPYSDESFLAGLNYYNNRQIPSVNRNKYFNFDSVEKLTNLPNFPGNYIEVEWKKLSIFNNKFVIFPEKFKPENFNQGNTGLCFLFSCLASIAGVPGLIHNLFGKNENWKQTKKFIVFLFYNNERKEIVINDNFPFGKIDGQLSWIWSKPEKNELFAKIIEKAYLKYKLTYGQYNTNDGNMFSLLKAIEKIIFNGGFEKEAMKILINTKEYKSIYNCNENNNKYIFNNDYFGYNNSYNLNKILDYDRIFNDIKNYIENKKALITLARKFDNNQSSGHAYSIIGAWEVVQGNNRKKIICIKNPWYCGDNQIENFDFSSLNNSLKNFPDLVDFNNKYFNPSNSTYSYNKYDYIVGNEPSKNLSSVFVAPLDFLIQNGLRWIEAHVPDYEVDFPSIKLELDLYNKLDKFFQKIQSNNVKNVFDSREDGNSTITRVISVGDENTREIISDIYNKNCFKITKNGKNYCQLERRQDGDFNFTNLSNLFTEDYMENNFLFVNNRTKEKKIVTLDELLVGVEEEKHFHDCDLIGLTHNPIIMPLQKKMLNKSKSSFFSTSNDREVMNPMSNRVSNEKNNHIVLMDTIKPKVFKNFTIKIDKKNKRKHKRINYANGYYIGYVLNNKRHGNGKMLYNNGEYEEGNWNYDKFTNGKVYYIYDNGDYYIGEISNGKKNGKGKYYFKNGDYFEGVYLDGKRFGYGEEKTDGVIFKGLYLNGQKEGKFERISRKGSFDIVEYENGKQKPKCLIF